MFTPDSEMTHQVIMKPWAEKVSKGPAARWRSRHFRTERLAAIPGCEHRKMLQDGVADIVWVISSYTPGVYLDDDVFELPNIIQNSTEGSVAAWRLLKKGMLRGYDQYHMIGLFTTSPYTIHTNVPIKKPEDLKGKKIRAVGAMSTETIKTIGAVPEGLPVTQVVEAMSRGVIDGTTGHPIAIFDFGISRVANGHFLGKVGTVTLGIFMNKAKFDSLPPKAKEAIEKNSGEVLSRQFGKMSEDRNNELIAQWKKDPERHRHGIDARTDRAMGQDAFAGSFRLGRQGSAQQGPSRGDAQGARCIACGKLIANSGQVTADAVVCPL